MARLIRNESKTTIWTGLEKRAQSLDPEIELEGKKSCEAREVLVELEVLPNLENADIFHLFEVFSSKRYI